VGSRVGRAYVSAGQKNLIISESGYGVSGYRDAISMMFKVNIAQNVKSRQGDFEIMKSIVGSTQQSAVVEADRLNFRSNRGLLVITVGIIFTQFFGL
jgi:hypothetical protein